MDLQSARDLAIVCLAVAAFLVTLLVLLWRLIRVLQREIRPVLTNLQQTANTVRGTTEFVSDSFVSPLIRLSSFFSGVGGTFKGFGAIFKRKEGKSNE
jgi:amino acid permease